MMQHDLSDRYDELRREWIAEHAGIWTVQKRRAELLNRRIRKRMRMEAGARPNPHDDNVIRPLWARRGDTAEVFLERFAVLLCTVAAPLGWPLGRLLYGRLIVLIPRRLRAVPVVALLWSAAGIGVVTAAVYTPDATFTTSFLAPYLVAQIPAVFASAAAYGVLNGWLAVDGSSTWWPVAPPPLPVEFDLALDIDDLTAPAVFDTADPDTRSDVVPPAQIVQSTESTRLVTAGVVVCLLGSVWMTGATVVGSMNALMLVPA